MSDIDLSNLRTIHDLSFDSPSVAERHLQCAVDAKLAIRDRPCGDCAVVQGLYSDIASCCHKFLDADGRIAVAQGWDCHNGGRCQGAALVLLSP